MALKVLLLLGRQRHVRIIIYLTIHKALTSTKVAAVCAEGLAVKPSGAAIGADLGGNSKYSSEVLED